MKNTLDQKNTKQLQTAAMKVVLGHCAAKTEKILACALSPFSSTAMRRRPRSLAWKSKSHFL